MATAISATPGPPGEHHPTNLDPEKQQTTDQEPRPETPEDLEKEKWNYPKHNILRLASVYLAFFNFGLNDASFGVGYISILLFVTF